MHRYIFPVFLCVAFLIGCATSPTGRRQFMIVSEESAIAASKDAYVEMLKPYAQKGKLDTVWRIWSTASTIS